MLTAQSKNLFFNRKYGAFFIFVGILLVTAAAVCICIVMIVLSITWICGWV